jgi:hypothetical protein
MLIDSRFRDYYDNIMSTGIDRDCVYRRQTQSTSHEKEIRSILPYGSTNVEGYEFVPFIIGFAGKLYPVVRIVKINQDPKKNINFHMHSLNDYIEFKKFHKLVLKPGRYYSDYELYDEKGMKEFFDENYKKYEDLFIKYKVPVFNIEREDHGTVLVLNPKLKDFDFVRVKDPFTAFQEIFMFQAGVLGNPEKEIVTISDKVKAQQHGHDGKYSFKKMPTKKK